MNSGQRQVPLHKAVRGISGHERRINCLIILIEAGLRWLGLKRTEKILSFFTRKGHPPAPAAEAVLIDHYVLFFNERKERKKLKGKCLSQSLALRFLLLRKGIGSELRQGVASGQGYLDAHAWLEKDGEVLNDHPSVISRYVVLPGHAVHKKTDFS